MDLGMARDVWSPAGTSPAVLDLRIAGGTADFREEPAMNPHQLACAMHAGRHAVERARLRETDLFIGGSAGSGNLTSAVSIACALLASSPERLTGADPLDGDQDLEMIRQGLIRHRQHLGTPIEVLRRLGGFAVAALTGSYLACAHLGVPVLVDGFVPAVAALTAVRLNPGTRDWLLFAQAPRQRRQQILLEALGARPVFDLGLCCEDGTGAVVAVPLLRLACALYGETWGAP